VIHPFVSRLASTLRWAIPHILLVCTLAEIGYTVIQWVSIFVIHDLVKHPHDLILYGYDSAVIVVFIVAFGVVFSFHTDSKPKPLRQVFIELCINYGFLSLGETEPSTEFPFEDEGLGGDYGALGQYAALLALFGQEKLFPAAVWTPIVFVLTIFPKIWRFAVRLVSRLSDSFARVHDLTSYEITRLGRVFVCPIVAECR
jgi:hypothetical protein